MRCLILVMFSALCTYASATHHHLIPISKEHHHIPHYDAVFKGVIPVPKPLPPFIPKPHPSVHHKAVVLHKPFPPPLPPIFPIKPIPKHHHKVPKVAKPPIVKPIPVPVPVPVPIPVPVHHHKKPALKPVALPLPVHKDLHKIQVHEHIDEKFKY